MSTDRLDRIEAIPAKNARQLVETRQLVESNAANLRETCAITVPMIADLGRQQQATMERSEQLNAEHSQRFEVCLQHARANCQRFDQAIAANSEEHRAFTQNIQMPDGSYRTAERAVTTVFCCS